MDERNKRGPSTFARDMIRDSCHNCFGTGKEQVVFRDFGGEVYASEADFRICPVCHGTGKKKSIRYNSKVGIIDE